ncbi:MAG: FAD-dependent oxidoreductase [Oligoflexia bacterium]|nr:FAD-dependent oxidoreductase [Oligoflexia bacterium]
MKQINQINQKFDAIVVGAGPAGTTAALHIAKGGAKVLLIERGKFVGAKNSFGGTLEYSPLLQQLIPDFWNTIPWERFINKRIFSTLHSDSHFSVSYDSSHFRSPPYPGCTLYRSVFDSWYANKALKAGVTLLTETTVTQITDNGVILNSKQEVFANMIVAADGVLSKLSQSIGLRPEPQVEECSLGLKLFYQLDEDIINERFNLQNREGVCQFFLGNSADILGGGFLYTQLQGLSVGIVHSLSSLNKNYKRVNIHQLLEEFVSQSPLKWGLKHAKLMEYSAHIIPKISSWKKYPIHHNRFLVVGDAAGFCYNTGLHIEGMNLAIESGYLAAQTVLYAHKKGDFSKKTLNDYVERIKESSIGSNFRTNERLGNFINDDIVIKSYPRLIDEMVNRLLFKKNLYQKKESIFFVFLDSIRKYLGIGKFFREIIRIIKSII